MSEGPLVFPMSPRLPAILAIAMLLALATAAPAASAGNCESRITVYSRHSVVHGPTPPAIQGTARSCLYLLNQPVQEDSLLLPKADQVLVRFWADLGPSVPTVTVKLEGLGFVGQSYVLHKQTSLYGYPVYEMADFVNIPAGPDATGTLKATVFVPGSSAVAIYRTP